jgi:two-component system, NarL family, response regulator NreC
MHGNKYDADAGSALKSASVRIVIADDHEIFRRGLRSLLESHSDWEVCGEAVNGQEAIEKVKQLKPDVVVLDVTMPQVNGLEAAREIRRIVPESKVVILSQHEPALMKQSALAAGAGAYVTKSEVSRELMIAIETITASN